MNNLLLYIKWWRKWCRRTDLTVLWPTIKQEAVNMTEARIAFAWHCYHDKAWTRDYSDDEIFALVEGLE